MIADWKQGEDILFFYLFLTNINSKMVLDRNSSFFYISVLNQQLLFNLGIHFLPYLLIAMGKT